MKKKIPTSFLLTNMFYDSSHLLETKNNKLNKLQLIEMWKTFYSKKIGAVQNRNGGQDRESIKIGNAEIVP